MSNQSATNSPMLRRQTKPIDRLVIRLMRIENFSLPQICRMVPVTYATVKAISDHVTPDNVEAVTMEELGLIPGQLADEIIASFWAMALQVLTDHVGFAMGQPRGQKGNSNAA